MERKENKFTSKQKRQVKHYIRQFFNQHYNALGKSKTEAPQGMIRSVRTFNHHLDITYRIMERLNIRNINNLNQKRAKAWLKIRKDEICKKSLQNEKKVLERILSINKPGVKLALPSGLKDREKTNRAYPITSIEKIMNRQQARTRLSTKLCYQAGLRAKEIYTLRRIDELSPSTQRQWRDDLFAGLEGEKYVVNGKGGLLRAVMIPTELAKELEIYRLDSPIQIKDRKADILTHYNLVGGIRFTNAFYNMSTKVLGYSHGAHGLRYTYAQQRMGDNNPGNTYETNKLIVSQELGHFRSDITDHYLNPNLAK
ncbi:integrase [Vibrio sp. 10N.261.46.A3]|uniref:integrase n=1 Tax=Vibrio sp. 10N.261.46.A3 TaxID=3229658 RepID=UPI00354FD38F